MATNLYGNSNYSLFSNGTILVTYPDSPFNLKEISKARTKSSLGLTWNSPNFTGGTPILDYTILLLTNGSYQPLASGIV